MGEGKHVFRYKNINSEFNSNENKTDFLQTLQKLRLQSGTVKIIEAKFSWNLDIRFTIFIRLSKLELFHMNTLICTNILKK